MTNTLTVLGPNGINDATFHVHDATCADINKPKYRSARADGDWETDADTEQALIEELFGDFIGTGETATYDDAGNVVKLTTWEDYRNEVRIFPCVGNLPETDAS